MSTTSPAGTAISETALQKEERIHPFRVFDAYERWNALIAFLVALVTYWSTVMPNIGLNDDGEMATAALHFGVMHPSGYPSGRSLPDSGATSFPLATDRGRSTFFPDSAPPSAPGFFACLAERHPVGGGREDARHDPLGRRDADLHLGGTRSGRTPSSARDSTPSTSAS